jgi:hypothetical protein
MNAKRSELIVSAFRFEDAAIRTFPGGSEPHLVGSVAERRGKEKKAAWEMFDGIDVGFPKVGAEVPMRFMQNSVFVWVVWNESIRAFHVAGF